jgi:hypothetical protein
MKQVAVTEQIQGQLRAAYGADANLDALVVYEAIALTSLPLRKAGGIFKGARNTVSLMGELASWIGRESVQLQLSHDTSTVPYGRVFYGEVISDELRVLFAVDKSHPDIIAKLDSGTLDQVSVGFLPKSLKCSACAFDYMAPNALPQLYMLECDDGHRIGEDGNFAWVDGLQYFFEMSLVGMGAVNGARIVGRSDARIANDPQFQQRLAASVSDFAGVRLSPTLKDFPEMNEAQMATFQAAVAGEATAKTELAAANAALAAANTILEAAQARVVELEADSGLDVEALQAEATEAKAVLQDELKAVLTALGKDVPADLPTELATLKAQLSEHRAAFAAVIPVGGAANQTSSSTPAAASTAAFQTRR